MSQKRMPSWWRWCNPVSRSIPNSLTTSSGRFSSWAITISKEPPASWLKSPTLTPALHSASRKVPCWDLSIKTWSNQSIWTIWRGNILVNEHWSRNPNRKLHTPEPAKDEWLLGLEGQSINMPVEWRKNRSGTVISHSRPLGKETATEISVKCYCKRYTLITLCKGQSCLPPCKVRSHSASTAWHKKVLFLKC